MMTESPNEILRQKERVHKDWFNENNAEIGERLRETRNAFAEWQIDVDSMSKNDRTCRVRTRKNYVVCKTGDGLEQLLYTDSHSSLKAVYDPHKPNTTPLLAADDSTLLKDKGLSLNVEKSTCPHS